MPESPARVRSRGGPPELFEALRADDDRWIGVAAAWDFAIVREPGAYVATLGDGIIRVAPYADLDPDDCLAQIVVHELCHFCVEGPESRHQWDWGLDNTTDADVDSELAAIRLQAAVLERYGLRQVLAPTTDFRVDYDVLPADPFEGPATVVQRARAGLRRLREHPARGALEAGLSAVATLVGDVGIDPRD